jgi:hypothetical protein
MSSCLPSIYTLNGVFQNIRYGAIACDLPEAYSRATGSIALVSNTLLPRVGIIARSGKKSKDKKGLI